MTRSALLTVSSGQAHMLDDTGGSRLVAARQSTLVRWDASAALPEG